MPPCDSRGPNTRGIGSHHRGAQRRRGAVQIGVRIARHYQSPGHNIALLDHHLMGNAGAGRVKVDAVLVGELLDPGVLRQIFRRDILNVVIDGEHRLCGIRDRRRADLLELWDHRAGVVMRHHMTRMNRNKIAGAHHGSRSESISVASGNLFNEREAHINYPMSISFP